jgi:hypothetical protein
MGGHTNFIVKTTSKKKTTSCAKNVALMLTTTPLYMWKGEELLQHEGVSKRKHHGDTYANQESGIDQTSQQEHFGLQFVHQFGLTSGRFQILATHDANTDTSTHSAQTDNQASGQCNQAKNVFHLNTPMD